MRSPTYLNAKLPTVALALYIAIIALAYQYSLKHPRRSFACYGIAVLIIVYIARVLPALMYFPISTTIGKLWEAFLFKIGASSHLLVRRQIIKELKGVEYNIPSNKGFINLMVTKNLTSVPTNHIVILCNSTDYSYELTYLYGENLQWPLLFFLKLQVDVLMWNYSGVGKSTGPGSLQRARDDSILVANFVRRTLKYNVVSVYGFSVGADIACYLANHAKINFLIADRGYGDLHYLQRVTVNSIWARIVSKLGWTGTPAKDYINCNCAKLMIGKVDNNMLPEIASLRSVVAQILISSYDFKNNWCALSALKATELVSATKQLIKKENQCKISTLIGCIKNIQIGGIKYVDCINSKNQTEYLRVWLSIIKVYLNATKRVIVTQIVKAIELAQQAAQCKESKGVTTQLKCLINNFSEILVQLGRDDLIEVGRMEKVVIIGEGGQCSVSTRIQGDVIKYMKESHVLSAGIVI